MPGVFLYCHPELVSGSLFYNEVLKQVQDDTVNYFPFGYTTIITFRPLVTFPPFQS